MPLITTCPITGQKIKLPWQLETSKPQVLAVAHPILYASLDELNKMQLPQDQKQAALLFAAYLVQLPELVTIQEPLAINHWPHSAIINSFASLKTLVNWLALQSNVEKLLEFLPSYRNTRESNFSHIQSWLVAVDAAKAEYQNVYMRHIGDREKRLAEANFQRWLDEEKSAGRMAPKLRKARNRRDFIVAGLSGHPQPRIDLVLNVVFNPAYAEVATILTVKEFCLDFLPETRTNDYLQKTEIIQKLDQVLAQKISLADSLDIKSDPLLAAKKQLVEGYTISHLGKEYTITDNAAISDAIKPTSKPLVNLPKAQTTEPLRENYSSDLAYKIAAARYKDWLATQK